jgi:hypothetical protein
MRLGFFAFVMAVLALIFLPPAEGDATAPAGTTLGSINALANTVTLVLSPPGADAKPSTTYTLSPKAVIKLDGNVVKLGHLHEGLRVTGYTEGSKGVLDTLDVAD